ncbi:MAG: hypothetical protein WAV41_04165 [Microgenomates group bacterium]
MKKLNVQPNESERLIAEATKKVDTALSGLNVEELMQLNLQVHKVEEAYRTAEKSWMDRPFDQTDQPAPQIPPLPEMIVIESDTRWHERLTSLVGEDRKFDHLVLGTLRQKLNKLARENQIL